MVEIVTCYGIGHQIRRHEPILTAWYESLRSGMTARALKPPRPDQVTMVGYGSCFRSVGSKSADMDDEDEFEALVPMGLGDLRGDLEIELLEQLSQGVGVEGTSKGLAQGALRRLEGSTFLGRPAAKVILRLIWQVGRYLDPNGEVRQRVQELFPRFVASDTKVVIGHSLGSIIAYEALCAHPEWKVDTFITLGSPLGLSAVRQRLVPEATFDGMRWPHVTRWHNIAAGEDPVALVKELKPMVPLEFRDRVTDHRVVNSGIGRVVLGGHSVLRYLTTAEVAEAVGAVLKDPDG